MGMTLSVTTLASPASAGMPVAAGEGSEGLVPGVVLVKYRPDMDGRDQRALERSHGASRAGEVQQLGVKVLRVPAGAETKVAAALSRSGKVEYADRDGVVSPAGITPNDPSWPAQWGPVKTGTSTVWQQTTGTAGVVLAVFDTGVDAAHPDLQGALVAGRDIVHNDDDPTDDRGHGTFVAGIVAARSNNA